MASDNFILPAHNWKWFMLRGVLALLLGAGAIVFPLSAVFAFTMLFAAYSLIDGVASLVAGARGATEPGHRWGALVFSGIIGILIGTALLQILQNLVNLLGIPSSLNFAVMGAVILVGVIVDQLLRQRRAAKVMK